MLSLKALKAREVLDSRGRPTVEVDVIASDGSMGRAIVPSGASTGKHEARELRDAEGKRYGGLGVKKAVENVTHHIAPTLLGMDLEDQGSVDATLIALDGTPDKRRLGANAVLGVSLAVAHAAAAALGEELFVHLNRLWRRRVARANIPALPVKPALPLPMVNMISGGLHAGGNLDIQDVMIVPLVASSYSEALETVVSVYRSLGAILRDRSLESALVADEGGFGPRLKSNEQAVQLVVDAILASGFEPGRDVAIALDIAASHFFEAAHGTYTLRAQHPSELDRAAMIDLLAAWAMRYPIVSIEDGLAEDDWDGWVALTAALGSSVQLVGDDLFTTQADRLKRGIELGAGNAILIKLNQVGTLSETLEALALARSHGFRTVVSARSGETEDTTIADLAVATSAGQIKIGSVARSERLAKYNRLLRIEEALGPEAPFAGQDALKPIAPH
jgi:enolase